MIDAIDSGRRHDRAGAGAIERDRQFGRSHRRVALPRRHHHPVIRRGRVIDRRGGPPHQSDQFQVRQPLDQRRL